jgi:hypothetical protein
VLFTKRIYSCSSSTYLNTTTLCYLSNRVYIRILYKAFITNTRIIHFRLNVNIKSILPSSMDEHMMLVGGILFVLCVSVDMGHGGLISVNTT